MRKEIRTVCRDETLNIEAYLLEGFEKPFPNHFHDYYVVGITENGNRRLQCRNREYFIGDGDIVVFNPGDNHCCIQSDGEALCYRGLNIPKDTMFSLSGEITGNNTPVVFAENVIRNAELSGYFLSLHKMMMSEAEEFEKEELFLLFMSSLFGFCGRYFPEKTPENMKEIKQVCLFMEKHFGEHMSLGTLCKVGNMSRSSLLRAFTKYKGITPYRYLQSLRIDKAKILLSRGVPPIEAAMKTGFSDQSHFTNFFTSFIGLSPGGLCGYF